MLWFTGVCFGSAFVTAWLVTAVMRRVAPRVGLVDHPAERKVHVTPTPLGGGVGIFLGTVLPIACAQAAAYWFIRQGTYPAWLPEELQPHLAGVAHRSGQMWKLLGCGSALFVVGLVDDWRGLSWPLRLSVQLIVAVLLVLAGFKATLFVGHPWITDLLSVLWIVVLINSLNFLDNMDGLTGGIGLIASLLFAAVMLTATAQPHWLVAGSLLVLGGACGGFLCHNWPPASIFMGDGGSTFIGMMLAALTVSGTFYDYDRGDAGPYVVLAPLCVLAVPLYDFASVITIRLLRGLSPFHADKNHFSHRLVQLGLRRGHAVLTVHLTTLTTGIGALLLYHVRDWTGATAVMALVVCVLTIVAILETAGRRAQAKHQNETPDTANSDAATSS